MSASRYRDRLDTLREQFSKIEQFVRNSQHADSDEVEEFVERYPGILDSIADQIEVYESVEDEIETLSENLQRVKGGAETLREIYDGPEGEAAREFESSYEEARDRLRETHGEYEEHEVGIEEMLEMAETLCTAVGNKIATAGEYDPTGGSDDDLDSATKANLDSILRGVTNEDRDDWYDP